MEPPPGRGYEMVSPADKNGTDVQNWVQIGADGESFAWTSLGGYAETRGVNVDVTYVGRRTAEGWRTTPFSPLFGEGVRPSLLTNLGAYAFPDDLSSMVFTSSGAFDPADRDGFGQFGSTDLYGISPSAETTWLTHGEDGVVPGGFFGARISALSADGSSVFFSTTEPLTGQVPPSSMNSLLYRWREGRVEAVGFDPSGTLLAGGSWLGADLSNANVGGTGHVGRMPDSLAISEDGTRFVYGGRPVDGDPKQLYLAEEGRPVRQLSLSQRSGSEGDPATADVVFMTATPDLSRIYLQTTDQLTDDAPVGGGDYVYDVETGELSFSNPDDSNASLFSVSGLTRLSDDGEYLYFISSAVLDDGAELDRRNLYVRHDGEDTLIATLADGDYGVAVVPSDNSVTNTEYTHASLSADGTKLVFESTASIGGATNAGRRAVYSYDAITGEIACVSCRPDGTPSEGDATLAPLTETYKQTPRGISADGETIVFTTSDALVAGDINGTDDVYEHSDGSAHLLSGGTSRFPSTLVGMSEDGRDVFFFTRQSLVATDTDNGLRDIYDARRGGGFAVSAPPQACQGDECQGPQAPQTPITPPASMNLPDLPPEEDVDETPSVTPRFSVSRVTAAQRRTLARTGRLTVRVRVNTSGRVGVALASRIGKRTVRVATAAKSARRASTVRVTVRLSAAARRRLAKTGSLRVSMAVSFSKARALRTQSFALSAARRTGAKRGTR